ncbi:MAG: glycerate kinase [Nitrospirae bacterium]|nr:glycerate kinase [Nitrospirota bacterium]
MTDSLIDIYNSAIGACSAYNCVLNYVDYVSRVYFEGGFKRLYVVGFGKGAYGMALAASQSLNDIIISGVAVTKYGHSESRTAGKIRILEAGHPVPDENGVSGTAEIIELVKDASADTLILCLISGGGSALFVSPSDGVSLSIKQEITELLLKSGCDINELNAVRKQLSKVKGGGFAALAYPAKILSLIISDVPGNRLDVIASGPTTLSTTGSREAIDVLTKYGLMNKLSPNIVEIINKGTGQRPVNVETIIIADLSQALNAAHARALELGFDAEIITDNISGDVKDAAKWLSNEIKMNNKLLISGGETTVTVTGEGRGGRNMELALRFALEIEGKQGITMLSAGTDGTDGPTDAAGAIVDGSTIATGRAEGLDAHEYLINNDSYTYFERSGGLFKPGPTGTNVMDIQLMSWARDDNPTSAGI